MLEERWKTGRGGGGGDGSSEQRGWVGSVVSFGDGGLWRANSYGQCNLRKAQATACKRDGPSGAAPGAASSEQSADGVDLRAQHGQREMRLSLHKRGQHSKHVASGSAISQ